MKLPEHPYTPSWRMKSNYLHERFILLRKKQEEQEKAESELQQQNMAQISAWK
jgi:hypothetical protein